MYAAPRTHMGQSSGARPLGYVAAHAQCAVGVAALRVQREAAVGVACCSCLNVCGCWVHPHAHGGGNGECGVAAGAVVCADSEAVRAARERSVAPLWPACAGPGGQRSAYTRERTASARDQRARGAASARDKSHTPRPPRFEVESTAQWSDCVESGVYIFIRLFKSIYAIRVGAVGSSHVRGARSARSVKL